MNQRAVPDEFDTVLHRALTDVGGAVHPDPGLADQLLANARSGRPVVASLATRRKAARWVLPLLAAASIVALSIGIAVVAGGRHHTPPLRQSTAPGPTGAPTTAAPTTGAPTTGVPTSAAPKPTALPHFRAGSVYFSDARHGWALGDARCGTGARTNCAALLATSDGGSSWRPLAVPKGLVSTLDPASCGTNGTVAGPCVDAVVFANPSDGYLWSLHELYWTTDGGRSWSRYVDHARQWTGASRLVVTDRAVVRIAPIAPCSAACPGVVETAPIGTTQWRSSMPTTRQVGLYTSNLAVADSKVYLFAGGTDANTGPGIYRSGDGARSWTLLARDACGASKDPQQDPFSGDGSTAADDGALVVTCAGSGSGSVRVAPPGSATFSPRRPYPPTGSIELKGARSEQHIVLADTADAYSGAHIRTTFYVTGDGGVHWRPTATLPVRGDGLQFTSGADGYAIGADRTELYTTHDGGTTWQATQFSG